MYVIKYVYMHLCEYEFFYLYVRMVIYGHLYNYYLKLRKR